MTKITAYHNPTAPAYRQWIAYVVLSDGKLWGVYAIGATEEAAKAKISTLWESERAKHETVTSSWDDGWGDIKGSAIDPDIQQQKQHHLANKVWMRHKQDGTLVRVPLTEITMYEGKGYVRSGPRSK